MNATTLEDRRWSTRINQELPLRYRASSLDFRKGSLINISLSGARLVVDGREVQAGPYLQLELALGDAEPVRVTATKRWERSLGSGHGAVIGVSFLEPGATSRARIAVWVANRLAEGLVGRAAKASA